MMLYNYTYFYQLLNALKRDSNSIQESWGFLTLSGNYTNTIIDSIIDLSKYLKTINNENSLVVKIDNENNLIDELSDYQNSNSPFKDWQININKLPLIQDGISNTFTTNFFLKIDALEEWIDSLDAFDIENPFLKYNGLTILTNENEVPILGPMLNIVPFNYNLPISQTLEIIPLPNSDKINETVRNFSNSEISINPKRFIITKGNLESNLSKKIIRLASLSLSACLVSEYYSNDKVIIDGIRQTNIQLCKRSDVFPSNLYLRLQKLISWLYEDKISTRLKLFNERLTLDIENANSLIHELDLHLDNAFIQAEKRFNFIILERKDKYISELKDLLKDIRSQSDLYALKIRTLLNNLLRDILATIVLIGFTIFTKFSDNLQLDKVNLLEMVFKGLSAYFIVSIVLQSIVDILDMNISNKEILYWKKATTELLPEKEFEGHISNSLKARRTSLKIIYPLIIIVYLSMAAVCYIYPSYFHNLSKSSQKIDGNPPLNNCPPTSKTITPSSSPAPSLPPTPHPF